MVNDATRRSVSLASARDVVGRMRELVDLPDALDAQNIARYTNLGAFPPFHRFPLSEQTKRIVLAEMMACSIAQASSFVDYLSSETMASVAELLSSPDVIEMLSLLPFKRGARVLAVGDSITSDRLGWAELMSLVASEVPQSTFKVVNMGVGGQTSADVISQIDIYADLEPDWVLLMVGTNDFRFHTEYTSATMLSRPETERNLLLIRRLIENELGARLVVVTPPPVVRPGVKVGTGAATVGWREGYDASLAEFIRSEFAIHIDVHSVLEAVAIDGLFEEDGIHPSAKGQRLILRTILLHLPSIGS